MKMEDYMLHKTTVVSKNFCLYQTLLVIPCHPGTKTYYRWLWTSDNLGNSEFKV